MKTAKKISVSGAVLSAAKNAEASLARQESQKLEQGLPEGHPLREEAEKQKAMLGDLSGLPPGHPLLRMMQAAKERYEHKDVSTEKQPEEVRKAKKVDEDKVRREVRREEDAQTDSRIQAAKQINSTIDDALEKIRELYRVMADHEEILNTSPISRARAVRLKRFLFAAERGMSECKIARA